MPRTVKSTRNIDEYDWGCPVKVGARKKSIVEAYRAMAKRDQIPRGRQYWTLCGRVGTAEGTLVPNCELEQVVQSGLVSWDQIYGVEIDRKSHALNTAACRGLGANLIHGNIIDVLDQYLGEKRLSPAVVNLDTLSEAKKGGDLLARAMDILNYVDGPIMVVWNIILEQEWLGHYTTVGEIGPILRSNGLFSIASKHGWSESGIDYTYTRSRASMCTFIFTRHGRARSLSKCG